MALLELSDITVNFAGLRALTNVSFALEPSEVIAVIGPNGAGKSTLFNVITGYVQPSKGTVTFDGRPIAGLPPHRISSLGMRRTFQNGGVFAEMTVLENVLTGLNQLTDNSPLGIVLHAPGAHRAEREATQKARDLLMLMGLSPLADKVAGDLSSGQQRLVEITRALAARTKILLLDEPAVGLSMTERNHLMTVLRDLAREGIGILLVEHTIDLVMAVSDRIVVLNYGQVIAAGKPAEIRSNPQVLEAYLGSA
jgi:branched-chain amino acid transport system ATP-binding protein